VGDDADPLALAVAGEVALDVDGGAGRQLGEVGGVAGKKDEPVAVDAALAGVALGEEEEAASRGRPRIGRASGACRKWARVGGPAVARVDSVGWLVG
jgi:hypothetical protein